MPPTSTTFPTTTPLMTASPATPTLRTQRMLLVSQREHLHTQTTHRRQHTTPQATTAVATAGTSPAAGCPQRGGLGPVMAAALVTVSCNRHGRRTLQRMVRTSTRRRHRQVLKRHESHASPPGRECCCKPPTSHGLTPLQQPGNCPVLHRRLQPFQGFTQLQSRHAHTAAPATTTTAAATHVVC